MPRRVSDVVSKMSPAVTRALRESMSHSNSIGAKMTGFLCGHTASTIWKSYANATVVMSLVSTEADNDSKSMSLAVIPSVSAATA